MAPRVERREFHIARSKLQHGYVLAGVLGAIGLALIALGGDTVPDAGLLAVVNLALAAAVLAMVRRSARDRRPRMVLDHEGLWYRDWGIGPVPWSAIARSTILGSRVQSVLLVRLRDAERFLAGLPEDERRRLRSNRLARLPDLRVPSGALEAPLEEIAAAIQDRLAATGGAARAQAPGP